MTDEKMLEKEKMTIYQWIFKSSLKAALIPFAILQLIVVTLFFGVNIWSRQQMETDYDREVQAELEQVTGTEGRLIQAQLMSVEAATSLYRDTTYEALMGEPNSFERNRLAYTSDGIYYTTHDSNEGGAAVFFSGYAPVGPEGELKVDRLINTQKFMKSVIRSNSLAASIYFNSYDSLNVIYPYFDVLEQYAPFMDIPKYNFYYEADLEHNPEKKVVWTDVYLDPAGHGWMISSIAPVYNGNFLEGVVGIDVTVSNIINQVLTMEIPYKGYGILVGKDGTILALPPQGEADLGVSELTDHSYSEAILEDTFKPADFNMFNNQYLIDISNELQYNNNGIKKISLSSTNRIVSWATIADTQWKLVLVVEEDQVYQHLNRTVNILNIAGVFLVLFLVIAYSYFVFVLARRTMKISRNISKPLTDMNHMIKKIGVGEYNQDYADLDVLEIEQTYNFIVDMGHRLADASRKLLESQDEVRTNVANFKALVNSIDDVIMEIDEFGTILHNWTNVDLEKYQKSGNHAIMSLEDLLDVSQSRKFIEKVNRVIASGKSETFEYKIDNTESERWYLAKLSLVDDMSRHVVVSSRDITERMEMEHNMMVAKIEAEKANRAKSMFLSNMSHELRTPLNAILGFAQILEMEEDEPLGETQAMSVQQILSAGKHLLVLINEVLDLAKIESGKVLLSMEPVSVKAIIDDTYSLIRPSAEKSNINFTVFYDQTADLFVSADFTRVKQILINLLSNAVKYNKTEGSIRLSVGSDGDKVIFSIVDTGIGMHKEELSQIFKPFYRINTDSAQVEGTGIGLAVAKELAELMNGSIKVESTFGVGSHFSLELKSAEFNEDSSEIENKSFKTSMSQAVTKTYKILYVEDNPANLALVQRIIKKIANVELISVMTGRACLEVAGEEMPDLILLDINLPDMNGVDVMKQLKVGIKTHRIPVVAVSANAMESDISHAKQAGFVEYITKPIVVSEFVSKITDLLGMK